MKNFLALTLLFSTPVFADSAFEMCLEARKNSKSASFVDLLMGGSNGADQQARIRKVLKSPADCRSAVKTGDRSFVVSTLVCLKEKSGWTCEESNF